MKLITMDFLHGFESNSAKHKHVLNDLMVVALSTSKAPNLLIIRLPGSKALKLAAKIILLALIFSTLPSLGSAIRDLPSIGATNKEILPLFFHEMSNEGHLKSGDKVLVVTRENDENIHESRNFGHKNEIVFVANTDTKRINSFPNKYFDFIFTHDIRKDEALIDRTLKLGGIATYEYNGKFHLGKVYSPKNYIVVYHRRYGPTSIVTLKKSEKSDKSENSKNGDKNGKTSSPTKRRLLSEGKKDVLEKLEDVLLEPPRAARSRSYLKKTKYLPDLLGDTLESYPRRVFIDVGPPEKTGSTGDLGSGWFAKHYPTKNKDFEIYKIDTVAEGGGDEREAHVGMSDWLRRNVKEEEYVVMKAEAAVVEEMVRNQAVPLVDELFLECKYQGTKGQSKKSRRAYWECLALYGRLRDEGVAVHQWWG